MVQCEGSTQLLLKLVILELPWCEMLQEVLLELRQYLRWILFNK